MENEVVAGMNKNKQLKKQLENKALLIWKMAIASALSWEIAKLAGSHHPYLAPISVILCLQTTVNRSIRFSYHRMVGTVIGITITVFAAPYLEVNGWTLGLLILAGGFTAKWLKRDETAIHQVALTVLLVFVFEHKAGSYPIDRFRDTLIGAIAAVVIHMIFSPPNFMKQAAKSFQELGDHLSLTFINTSNWIQTGLEKGKGYELQIEVKKLLKELRDTKNILKTASDSLEYNPFGKKSMMELQGYHQRIYYLNLGYTYLSSIVGTFVAWTEAGTINPLQLAVWAEQLKSLSPFFDAKENPAELELPGELLKISISTELEKQQFHISLYHETTQLLKKMKELPRIKN
jgi:uncharacterized membrane protein YgaE (UPF0421/DUF939 family)